jgi:hypothetical protein
LGGIARRATKITEARRRGTPTIVVDAGGFAPLYDQQGEIKFEVLLESFRQMQYDAISIGEREILMHQDAYNVWEKLKAAGIPIVTLNVAYRGEKLRAKPLIVRRGEIRVGVFSLFISGDIPESANEDWTIEDPEKGIDGALAYARKNADFVVAMLHGDLPQVREFVKRHKGMDIVIVSYSATKSMRPEKINGSLLLSTESEGKYLSGADASLKGGTWEFDPRVIALDRTVPEDPVLTKTYARYLERVAQLSKELTKEQEEGRASQFPPVLQAQDCQSCHNDLYQKWAETPHAHAMKTLIKKKEHRNPECIVCHSTYYLKGGFVSWEKTPEYAGVQCAQCHGRMDGHIKFHSGKSQNLDAPPQVQQTTCLQCHTPDQDDDFDFERDKKLVH